MNSSFQNLTHRVVRPINVGFKKYGPFKSVNDRAAWKAPYTFGAPSLRPCVLIQGRSRCYLYRRETGGTEYTRCQRGDGCRHRDGDKHYARRKRGLCFLLLSPSIEASISAGERWCLTCSRRSDKSVPVSEKSMSNIGGIPFRHCPQSDFGRGR